MRRDSISNLVGTKDVCNDLVERIDEALRFVEDLTKHYAVVENKSHDLQVTCETILDEQVLHSFSITARLRLKTRLEETLVLLSKKLEYFIDLEPITRLFSTNSDRVCLEDTFIPMLQRLDDCIDYLEQKVRPTLWKD